MGLDCLRLYIGRASLPGQVALVQAVAQLWAVSGSEVDTASAERAQTKEVLLAVAREVEAAVKPPPSPIFNGTKISKKCAGLTVELVKHISRLLQRVERARIIAQNFLFYGRR